jgi:hypothetical protein
MALGERRNTVLWKIAKGISAIAAFLVGVIAFPVLLFGIVLYFFFQPSEHEVARVGSPDDAFDAVLIETDGGATTSFGYLVYVVDRGERASGPKLASLYGAKRNEKAYGANLRWQSATALTVEFYEAKYFEVHEPGLLSRRRPVSVVMRSGVHDSTASPGGMHYRLRLLPNQTMEPTR